MKKDDNKIIINHLVFIFFIFSFLLDFNNLVEYNKIKRKIYKTK